MEYKYKIREIEGRPVIAIRIYGKATSQITVADLNGIIDSIAKENNINPVEHFIVFGSAFWNGYIFSTNFIATLNCMTWTEAATAMINQ